MTNIDPTPIFKAFYAVSPEHRGCVRWVVSPAFHRALYDSEQERRDALANQFFVYPAQPAYEPNGAYLLMGMPMRVSAAVEMVEVELTCEEVVHVGFNEPRCGRFEMYDNQRREGHTHAVPRSLWASVMDAERALFAAKTARLAAITAVLDHVKANAEPDANVRLFSVDRDGIYW